MIDFESYIINNIDLPDSKIKWPVKHISVNC